MVTSTRIIYTNRIIVYTENTIDQLAPMIDEQKEEELLAKFRNVSNTEEYRQLFEELEILREKNGLKTGSFKPL